MSVTFDYSSNTAVIQNPLYPESLPELPRQELGRSDGGAHFVFIRGVAAKQINLQFRRLSQTDKDNLMTWIQDQANYMENTFTYTDPHGTGHEDMRLVSFGRWFYREQSSNLWAIELTLEEDEGL